MTCHIAIASDDCAVLFSDSQATAGATEIHGIQKQFGGPDFLLGISGDTTVAQIILQDLYNATWNPEPGIWIPVDPKKADPVNGTNVSEWLRNYLSTWLTPEGRSSIEMVLITPKGDNSPAIRIQKPRLFNTFNRSEKFATIGSGADYVERRYLDDYSTAGELFYGAWNLMEAANASLHVDDKFLIGLINKGKAYLIGDKSYAPELVRDWLSKVWNQEVCKFYSEAQAAVTDTQSEIKYAIQSFNKIRKGAIDNWPQLQAHNDSIKDNLTKLTEILNEYCQWFDEQRQPIPK